MSVKEAAELKGLQVRLQKAKAEEENCRIELIAANRKMQAALNEVSKLQEQIKAFTESDPVVTEHAMLRYVERVMGIDLEAVRADILTPTRRAVIKAMGTGKVDMPNGNKLVFKNRAVVTIE